LIIKINIAHYCIRVVSNKTLLHFTLFGNGLFFGVTVYINVSRYETAQAVLINTARDHKRSSESQKG